MKTTLPFQRKIVILAMLAWITIADAKAQTATDTPQVDQQVIAITPTGNIIRAPALLRVNVQLLAPSSTLLISLENRHQRGREVIINLRDNQNRIIHRIRSYKKALAFKINLRGLETGSYQVEVANRYERYKYNLQIKMKTVTSIELEPQALLRDEAIS